MFLKLENFRRFHKPDQAQIAPITILLGENSSGKTSFAAGFRYIVETMSFRGEGSFNREPFFLGAYDQIAHYRGGRFGRSPFFSLTFSLNKLELDSIMGKYGVFGGRDDTHSDLELSVRFENSQSQPVLKNVTLKNDAVNIELDRDDLPKFKIKIDQEQKFSTVSAPDITKSGLSLSSSLVDRNNIGIFWDAVQNYQYNLRRTKFEKKVQNENDNNRLRAMSRFPIANMLFTDDIAYASAPFRTRPERTYSPVEASSSAEGSHIPILMAQAKAFEKERWQRIKEKLEAFGAASLMFRKVDVKRMGRNQSDPFQIIITVSKDHSNLIDVGYGVSQILPLLVETLINDRSLFFLFQQPEVHLHPRAQAELGSYFVDFVLGNQKYVILETHSDFMIDRIKSDLQRRGINLNESLSILFFERSDFETRIHRIKFDDDGNVVDPPLGYRSFFINESARVLGL